jgi:hypothetical protein
MLSLGVQALACLGLLFSHPSFASDLAPITKDGVTLRFIEAGTFRGSLAQGMEVDVVNPNDRPVTCDVELVLQRDGQEVKRTSQRNVALPAHARVGFRVAEPLTYGSCKIAYEVKVNGTLFADDSFEFQGTGPYRLSIRPWFLTRDAIQVKVELLSPSEKHERFRFKLLDGRGRRVLYQTEDCHRVTEQGAEDSLTRPKTTVEAFVSFKNQRPAHYIIEVEVLGGDGNQRARPVGTVPMAWTRNPGEIAAGFSAAAQ